MATATATNDHGREERRRKIIDRGSDRIALITGRHGQTLPSSPRSVDDAQATGDLSPPSSTGDHPQIHHAADPMKDTPEDNEASRRVIGGQFGADAVLRDERPKGEILPLASQGRTDPVASAGPRDQRPKLFSSRQLNSCILESERTRGFCALIIAVLVVLSYVSYPLFGSHVVKSGSIIAARPLYILLLTDVSIVLARLFNAQKNSEEAVEERKLNREENQSWDGAVKLLERGLVAYQSVRAVFIDCSIYMGELIHAIVLLSIGNMVSVSVFHVVVGPPIPVDNEHLMSRAALGGVMTRTWLRGTDFAVINVICLAGGSVNALSTSFPESMLKLGLEYGSSGKLYR